MTTNLLLLAGVLVLGLLFAELALRLIGFKPVPVATDLFIPDDTLGWIGRPQQQAIMNEGGQTFTVQMNLWGFRDKEPPSEASTTGKRRLMFLGDSFVMGSGIPVEARVSDQLEKQEAEIVSYNFGILGYSTDQELLTLKKFGPVIKPDVVLLFFCANDLIYNDSDFGHRKPKPHFHVTEAGHLQLGNVPVPKLSGSAQTENWLASHLALGRLLDTLFARLAFRREGDRRRPSGRDLGLTQSEKGEGDIDSLVLFSPKSNIGDLTYYLLKETRDECQRQNAQLLVFTVPSNQDWTAEHPDTPREIQRVLDWCSQLGIHSEDLFPYFYQDYAQHQQTLYTGDKMHWNERGNQVAAKVVLQTLNTLSP